ncbi:NSRP1 protein, partial [Dasyornis broadbenti]|nr:NSRP1 protein [Dasyornis broadbenti]
LFFFLSRYGLIMPKKLPQKNLVSKKLSVFADESDEEPTVGESLQKEALKKQAMKQTKLEIQKALEEDATVYEYDSIYDEMQQKKKESSAKMLAGNDDKKPRYIHNILKAAEIRKKEQERRMERKIQKEREMEGGEFAHKEAFVTSAYKKKLQERAEEEERERRESALEAYLDVTKQRDLSGFYRHLLNQSVGEEEMPKCSFREARIEEEKPDSQDEPNERNKCSSERQRVKPSKKENNPDADTDLGTDSSDDDKRHKHSKIDVKKKKRRGSSVSSEEEDKHHKSQRCSRSPSSSSVEEEPRTKALTNHPAKRGESRPSRRGNDEQYWEKDYERSRIHEKDHQREREERHRHGDHTNKDHYRRREDQDDKQRGKERKEREGHGREWRRAKEREEKGSEKERDKERTRNDKDRYNDREKERGENYREREDYVKERREKYGSDEKKYRERRGSTPTSLEKDGETGLGKERKGKDREVDEKGSSSSGVLSEQKRKAGEEGDKEEKEQAQKAPESMSKFAKRSNEETVMSARDRYLARQMARVSTKSYIEKEED